MPENPRYLPLIWKPVHGVNSELNPAALGQDEVQSALNFIFANEEAATRPGLATFQMSGMSGKTLKYAASILSATTSYSQYYTFFFTADNKLYYTTTTGTSATELTLVSGNALAILGGLSFCPIAVNGAIVFPSLYDSIGGGVIRWVPGAANITAMVSAGKQTFGTAHLSRMLLARSDAGAVGGITVEWSKPGDETVWNTSPSTDGSGSTVLADAPDEITGLKTINNVVVVLRETGIHLGFPTGVSIPPFRWESFVRGTTRGCPRANCATVAVDSNELFWLGADDVYMFDLNEVTPIGGKVRSAILGQAAQTSYCGFVSHLATSGGKPRRMYNLMPCLQGGISYNYHFQCDLQTGIWSIHDYNIYSNYAFLQQHNASTQRIAFILTDTSQQAKYWDPTVVCERAATMTTGSVRVGDYSRDMSCERALLAYRDCITGSGTTVALHVLGTYAATLADLTTTNTVSNTLASKWRRLWYNLRGLLGQDIYATITTQAGLKCSFDHVQVELSEQGGYRG